MAAGIDTYLGSDLPPIPGAAPPPPRPRPRPTGPGNQYQSVGGYAATSNNDNLVPGNTNPSTPGINGTAATTAPPPGGYTVPTGAHTNDGFMLNPGEGEQYWNNNQNKLYGPSNAGQYWNGVSGQVQGGTNSQNLYNQGQSNIDSYYNNAQKTASTQLNDQLAARGVYDSGAGLDQQGLLSANLAGQKAMAQMGYMKDLAGQADTQNQSAWRTGGALAGQNDQSDLDRLMAGGKLAFGAQDAMQGRERGNLQDMMGWSNQLGGAFGQQTNQAMGDQKDLSQQLADITSQIGSKNSKDHSDAMNQLTQIMGIAASAYGGK